MKGSTNFLTRTIGVALLVGLVAPGMAGPRSGAGLDPAGARRAAPELSPPLADWDVDAKSGAAEIRSHLYANAKAPEDKATVFRPVTPCRLIDTRGTGTGGAFVINGPLVPGASVNVITNGLCGIPNTQVAGLSLSFHVQNLTVNNGGYISFLQTGAAVSGTNAVFNLGATWTAATANVSIPNSSGDFYMFIAESTVEVVVDVNGYFQDLNSLDVGTQQFDLFGTGSGSTFQFSNSGVGGTALTGGATGTNGTGIRLTSGRLAVTGADNINGSNAVFVHRANSAAFDGVGAGTLCSTTSFADFSIINHPMTNNNPDATLFITARSGGTNGPLASAGGGFEAYYVTSGCTNTAANNKWAVRSSGNIDHATGDTFNVMIIDD